MSTPQPLDSGIPDSSASSFAHSLALVIGIDRYANGLPQLRSAVNDACRLAEVLTSAHGYTVTPLLDEAATGSAITRILNETLPAQITKDDRLLVYFAGHGLAEDGDNGPAGYLVPQDAQLGGVATLLPMTAIYHALEALPCRHLLLILDCCFAGAFDWATTRQLRVAPPLKLYREHYERFVQDAAWEALTSAAADQTAADITEAAHATTADITARFGERRDDGRHSPFALALFDALAGQADLVSAQADAQHAHGDGVITATELYLYLRDRVELEQAQRQTPGLWFLPKHDKGEFIFGVPGQLLDLQSAPPLDPAHNPYRGRVPYEKNDRELFFGRAQPGAQLLACVLAQPLTVVTGTLRSGKSSLVNAGLLPLLQKDPSWRIVGPVRFGASPVRALATALGQTPETFALSDQLKLWLADHSAHVALVLDQFEELVTLASDSARASVLQALNDARVAFPEQLRIILSVRADLEPRFAAGLLKNDWTSARFVVPHMTQDELRDVIVKPAAALALYFESDELVERIINEVAQMPGDLPLLSLALNELYLRYLARGAGDRTLRTTDYDALGGVVGSLRTRADGAFESLGPAERATMKRVLLRMVSLEGGELARRRVTLAELTYTAAAENTRVTAVLSQLEDALLIVAGLEVDGEPYVEPAHDALVQGWDKLLAWVRAEQESLILQQQLTSDAFDWARSRRDQGLLWTNNPRLGQADAARRVTDGWLNAVESEYVAASEQRRKRNQYVVIGVGAMVFLGLTLLTIFANFQRNDAVASQQTAVSEAHARATAQTNAEANAAIAIEQRNGRATQAAIAQTQEAIAVSARDSALKQYAASLAANALSTMGDNPELSLLLATQSISVTYTVQGEEALHQVIENSHIRRVLTDTRNTVMRDAVFSPDGKRIVSVGENKLGMVSDAISGERLFDLVGHGQSLILSAQYNPTGSLIATAGGDHNVILWDAANGALRSYLGDHADKTIVNQAAFSPDGHWIVSAGTDHTARVWDVDACLSTRFCHSLVTFTAHVAVNSVAFDPTGEWVVSADQNGIIAVWNRITGQARLQITSTVPVHSVIFSPQGAQLISAHEDGAARIWDAQTGELLNTLRGHTAGVWSARYSAAGDHILTAGADGAVTLWDAKNGINLMTLRGHTGGVHSATFDQSGNMVVTAGDDKTVRIWDLRVVEEAILHGHTNSVLRAVFNADGTQVASASVDKTARVWDMRTGSEIAHFNQFSESVLGVAFSPDGKYLATASADKTARVWELATQQLVLTLTGHSRAVTGIAYSPDGKSIATSSEDQSIRLWDSASGAPLVTITTTYPMNDVDFSPDGKTVVSGDSTLGEHKALAQIWAANSGDLVQTFNGITFPILAASYSPDGRRILTAGGGTATNTPIRIWDVAAGTELTRAIGATLRITSAVFSPDGKRLMSASRDHSLRFWDASSGSELMYLRGNPDQVSSAAYSRDGKYYLTTGTDGDIRIYLTQIDDVLALARSRVTRGLTCAEKQRFLDQSIACNQ